MDNKTNIDDLDGASTSQELTEGEVSAVAGGILGGISDPDGPHRLKLKTNITIDTVHSNNTHTPDPAEDVME